MDGVPQLDLKAQYATLRGEMARALEAVLEAQAFVLGPTVERFEAEMSGYLDGSQAIGCASGTDALILSLAALDVGPGDQVVTSPFTFFATASCAYKVGARPVFVDVEPGTLQIDPNKVEAAIGPRTRALLPVHLFGQCCDMDALLAMAERHRLPVVEDACQALGARHLGKDGRSRPAGTLGRTGTYSFFPSKNLGGYGDGGLVATGDLALAARLRKLRVHGAETRYHHLEVGWNSRLDALQAAVLSVKLKHLDAWSKARADNADRYDRLLAEAGLVAAGKAVPLQRAPYSTHIFHQYTVRVKDRDAVAEHLRTRGIGHAIYYPVPLHLQECFRDLGYRAGALPVAEQAAREVLSLPMYPELTAAQQERVVAELVTGTRKG
jgi:dTDP-4-amino-4,6-dideoxygalactose transaminase